MSKTTELYRKYRPRKLSEVVGQDEAKNILEDKLENKTVPQAILFAGPSGCGKTTFARILAKEMGCQNLEELNCANFRGIDDIRDINIRMGYKPTHGPCRVWILDECHQLMKTAQSLLLKMLEDPPDHAYFFLATTEPGKLLTTIKTRCTLLTVKALTTKQLEKTVLDVCARAKITVPSVEVVGKLVSYAEGSARSVVKLWDQVRGLKTEEAQLAAITSPEAEKQGFEIAQALMQKKRWPDVALLIKSCDQEPETIRRIILGYANTTLLGCGKFSERALFIINSFRDHWYDVGKVGLSAACYEVCSVK